MSGELVDGGGPLPLALVGGLLDPPQRVRVLVGRPREAAAR